MQHKMSSLNIVHHWYSSQCHSQVTFWFLMGSSLLPDETNIWKKKMNCHGNRGLCICYLWCLSVRKGRYPRLCSCLVIVWGCGKRDSLSLGSTVCPYQSYTIYWLTTNLVLQKSLVIDVNLLYLCTDHVWYNISLITYQCMIEWGTLAAYTCIF